MIKDNQTYLCGELLHDIFINLSLSLSLFCMGRRKEGEGRVMQKYQVLKLTEDVVTRGERGQGESITGD